MKDFFVGFALIVLAIVIALHKDDGEHRELMQMKKQKTINISAYLSAEEIAELRYWLLKDMHCKPKRATCRPQLCLNQRCCMVSITDWIQHQMVIDTAGRGVWRPRGNTVATRCRRGSRMHIQSRVAADAAYPSTHFFSPCVVHCNDPRSQR